MNIALAGHPNSGKSLLFNTLTGGRQHVGNWPRVTVAQRYGTLRGKPDCRLQDLPGIYSLGADTLDGRIAADYLRGGHVDRIVNVLDATGIERGLPLTLELLSLGIPTVVALNMMDVAKSEGIEIDTAALSSALGCPVIPVSALRKTGMEELTRAMTDESAANRAPLREAGAEARRELAQKICGSCVKGGSGKSLLRSDQLDAVLTNRFLGLPIFAGIMVLIYSFAITGFGKTASMFIKKQLFGVTIAGALRTWFAGLGVAEWLSSLVIDGVVSGVGSVLRYAPRLLLLFLFISILEDSGYMVRAAFLLDRLFRRFGLSGKSFIPLFVCTGCAVPGIMACKTVDDEADRRITVMTASFMPCGMKMAVVALFAGSVFGGSGLVSASVYFVGLFAVLLSGLILKGFQPLSPDDAPFILELPNYRLPSLRNVWANTWERTWTFMKRAGTIILLMSVVIWFLQKCGFTDGRFGMLGKGGKSLLACFGGFVAPIFKPLGFGFWQAVVATVCGFVVKEGIVGSLGVLFGFTNGMATGGEIASLLSGSFTALSAYSFLLFNLLCMPCFGAVGAIRREMNSARWVWGTIAYQFAFAYAAAFVFYQFGLLFTGSGFSAATAMAATVAAAVTLLAARKRRGTKNVLC